MNQKDAKAKIKADAERKKFIKQALANKKKKKKRKPASTSNNDKSPFKKPTTEKKKNQRFMSLSLEATLLLIFFGTIGLLHLANKKNMSVPTAEQEQLLSHINDFGYETISILKDAKMYGVKEHKYGAGLYTKISTNSYEGIYYFGSVEAASRALVEWDSDGHPGEEWIYYKGDSVGVIRNPNVSTPGAKVTVRRSGRKGIVSRARDHQVWVVLDCNEDWDNYDKYPDEEFKYHEIKPGW